MTKLAKLIKNANFVYICGNGGSASTSNHFAQDLVKICGVKAISLCANEALVMAYGNDDGYNNIFYNQLDVFYELDDLLITISGSGTSENIVSAQDYIATFGGTYYAFPTMHELKCNMQEAENKHLKLAHQVVLELSQ